MRRLFRSSTSDARPEPIAASRLQSVTSRWLQVAGLGVIGGMLALGSAAGAATVGRAAAVPLQGGSTAGQFLVATDELRDPRFVRTVIYMVRHDANGAMGLVVNRPVGETPFADLLDRLGIKSKSVSGEIRVHYGGPVEPGRGFVLHTSEYRIESTQVIQGGIAITVQPEILGAIADGTGPRRALFALGYSGWAPGQLEAEMDAGAWVVVPADEGLLFNENYEKKWERAMARRMIRL